jgi:hypothetical protein
MQGVTLRISSSRGLLANQFLKGPALGRFTVKLGAAADGMALDLSGPMKAHERSILRAKNV